MDIASIGTQISVAEAELDRITKFINPTNEQKAAMLRLRTQIDDMHQDRAAHAERERKALKSAMYDNPGSFGREGGTFGMDESVSRRPPLVLRKNDSMREWATKSGLIRTDAEPMSFSAMIKGMATNDWRGASIEKKALGESVATEGGHMVPTPLASGVIDLVRNSAQVMQAGATVVPMTAETLKLPRLATEGSPSWRNEATQINDTAMSFDAVTLEARSLAILIKISWELLEDAPPGSDVIERSFAAQMALELDRVALRGSGTAPEPKGVRNQTGVTVTPFGGANGAAPLDYDHLIDAAQVLRAVNFEPNAVIQAPRSENTLQKLKEATTNAYLQPPPNQLPRLLTNQIPVNLTVGTSTDCSAVYVADWSQLLIGLRTGFSVRVLSERYADFGQVGFLAHLRADVQLARAEGFNVITGVRP